MLKVIIGILLFGGLLAFSTYQLVQIVRTIRERKKVKSKQKENVSDVRNSNFD